MKRAARPSMLLFHGSKHLLDDDEESESRHDLVLKHTSFSMGDPIENDARKNPTSMETNRQPK